MKKVNKKELKDIILRAADKGRIFGVSYIKKDGTLRVMNCRKKQFNLLKGGARSWNPEEVNSLFVVDTNLQQFRTLNFDTLVSAKVDGIEYNTID